MNLGKVNMTNTNYPYDLWKAKADLVDFYKTEIDRLRVLNQLLLAGLAFSFTVISILGWYLCKYL